MFTRRQFTLASLSVPLAACSEPISVPWTDRPATGPVESVFVATIREQNTQGEFTAGRAATTRYLSVPVQFPESYTPGKRAFIRSNPNPSRHFSVDEAEQFDRAGFRAELRRALSAQPRGRRDITIYVHGFYNAFYNGVFQAAQLRRDFDLPGIMLHFAWPSRGSNTAYAYDRESMLYSRDALEQLVRDAARVGAERVTLIGHSLGSMLIMEALRQVEIAQPGWTHAHIDGLSFVAPDIDVDVFKTQAARFKRLPKDTVLFVSDRDKILMLATTLTGGKARLGNLRDVRIVTEGELTIVDVAPLAGSAWSGHFIPATSPIAISLLRNSEAFVNFFPREGAGQRVGANRRFFQLSEG